MTCEPRDTRGARSAALPPIHEPGTFAGLVAAEREQRRRDGLAA